jgi:hypothetical protein
VNRSCRVRAYRNLSGLPAGSNCRRAKTAPSASLRQSAHFVPPISMPENLFITPCSPLLKRAARLR